jgi:hypothetical protein
MLIPEHNPTRTHRHYDIVEFHMARALKMAAKGLPDIKVNLLAVPGETTTHIHQADLKGIGTFDSKAVRVLVPKGHVQVGISAAGETSALYKAAERLGGPPSEQL